MNETRIIRGRRVVVEHRARGRDLALQSRHVRRPRLTMAKQPTNLREWRISIMRDKVHYLGRVVGANEEAAIARAMEEFRIEPAWRFRVIAGRWSEVSAR